MPTWIVKLLDIVWTSVLSVVFALTAIIVALALPNATALTIALTGTSITLALLSQKA